MGALTKEKIFKPDDLCLRLLLRQGFGGDKTQKIKLKILNFLFLKKNIQTLIFSRVNLFK